VAFVEEAPFSDRLGSVSPRSSALKPLPNSTYACFHHAAPTWRHRISRRMHSHANGRGSRLASPGWAGRHSIIWGNSGAKPAPCLCALLHHVEGARQVLAHRCHPVHVQKGGLGRMPLSRISVVNDTFAIASVIYCLEGMLALFTLYARHSWPPQPQEASSTSPSACGRPELPSCLLLNKRTLVSCMDVCDVIFFIRVLKTNPAALFLHCSGVCPFGP
jgi:hypothetical protein